MKYINKILFVCLLTIVTLIILKSNSNLKTPFYKYVYEDNISFSDINNLYKKYFGNQIPFLNNSESVFKETLKYSEAKKYKDGVELKVENEYLIPALKEGMVVFIGEKEEYGNTIIISGIDGIDIWYSNINSNINLYDYIEENKIIGSAIDSKIYITIKKGDQILNYEDYI